MPTGNTIFQATVAGTSFKKRMWRDFYSVKLQGISPSVVPGPLQAAGGVQATWWKSKAVLQPSTSDIQFYIVWGFPVLLWEIQTTSFTKASGNSPKPSVLLLSSLGKKTGNKPPWAIIRQLQRQLAVPSQPQKEQPTREAVPTF